jgi:hypothetical protein
MGAAWRSPISHGWSWPHSRVRAGFVLKSISNPFSKKLNLDSKFFRSAAELAFVPWGFRKLIPKIQQIELSGLLRLSRDYPYLQPTEISAARKRLRQFGKTRPNCYESDPPAEHAFHANTTEHSPRMAGPLQDHRQKSVEFRIWIRNHANGGPKSTCLRMQTLFVHDADWEGPVCLA